jgi:hypothetical protein
VLSSCDSGSPDSARRALSSEDAPHRRFEPGQAEALESATLESGEELGQTILTDLPGLETEAIIAVALSADNARTFAILADGTVEDVGQLE